MSNRFEKLFVFDKILLQNKISLLFAIMQSKQLKPVQLNITEILFSCIFTR